MTLQITRKQHNIGQRLREIKEDLQYPTVLNESSRVHNISSAQHSDIWTSPALQNIISDEEMTFSNSWRALWKVWCTCWVPLHVFAQERKYQMYNPYCSPLFSYEFHPCYFEDSLCVTTETWRITTSSSENIFRDSLSIVFLPHLVSTRETCVLYHYSEVYNTLGCDCWRMYRVLSFSSQKQWDTKGQIYWRQSTNHSCDVCLIPFIFPPSSAMQFVDNRDVTVIDHTGVSGWDGKVITLEMRYTVDF